MKRSVVLCLPVVLLGACGPATPAANPPPAGHGNPPGPGGPPPPTDERHSAPLVVSLQQNSASGDETEILLTLETTSPFSYPLSLTATAPAGAQITGGQPQETLTVAQPGKLTRIFRVKGPLTQQAPFSVVIHGAAPDRSSGVHADKKFPPPAELAPPKLGPPPPGGRPPGPVPR